MYDNRYTTKHLYSSLHKNYSKDRCPDLWWKTAFRYEITKRETKDALKSDRRIGSMVKALAFTNVDYGVETLPLKHVPVTPYSI